MNSFDIILAALDTDTRLSPGIGKQANVYGARGGRSAQWRIAGFDDDLMEIDSLVGAFKEEIGMEVDQTPLIQEGEYDEDEDEHRTLMLGRLDQGDADCWAIIFECELFDGYPDNNVADITLMEGRSNILSFLGKRTEENLRIVAKNLVSEIRRETGGDPQKLLQLRTLLQNEGGQDILTVWDSAAVGKDLDATTAPAKSSGPKTRF